MFDEMLTQAKASFPTCPDLQVFQMAEKLFGLAGRKGYKQGWVFYRLVEHFSKELVAEVLERDDAHFMKRYAAY